MAKSAKVEVKLRNVILSFPDLHNPKPFEDGSISYNTDILMEPKNRGIQELEDAIEKVVDETWGDERPKKLKMRYVEDGNDRQEHKGYKGRFWIKAGSKNEVPVFDEAKQDFPANKVRGGMFANVLVTVSAYDMKTSKGVTIYLNGVQVLTEKEWTSFGGGTDPRNAFDDEDDTPPAKRRARDQDEDAPKKGPPRRSSRDEDEEDEPAPRKRASRYDDEDDDN